MEEFIAEINRMLSYFPKKQALYDEYETYRTRLSDRKRALARERRRYRNRELDFLEILESLIMANPIHLRHYSLRSVASSL